MIDIFHYLSPLLKSILFFETAISELSCSRPVKTIPHFRVRVDQAGGAWCPRNMIGKDGAEWLEVDLGAVRMDTERRAVQHYGRVEARRHRPLTCRPIAQPHPGPRHDLARHLRRLHPPLLHLLPRLALEGGHGLPAQLLRGRRHLALRVIPRRLPTRPLVAPHTHIPHRTPRLVRLSPQHTPSPSVRGPALSQCEWLA